MIVTLLAALIFFLAWVGGIYDIRRWLFWRYAGYWLGSLAWLGSCLVAGYAFLGRFFPRRLPKREQLTLGLAVGVLAFGLAIFFIGLVRGLNVVTFVALPLAFAGFGLRTSGRELRKFARRAFRGPLKIELWMAPVLVLAVLAISIVYFQILSPETFSFDVRWYHIPIAQRYALTGAVERFVEGFWPATFPHLLSYLYAWVFLTPGTLLFDRLEFCVHLEFVLFLATLAQIPVLVRRMVPGSRARFTWVAFLLFPGLYLYDLNLHAGADHPTAFWALPIALTFFNAWRRFDVKNAALCGLMLSAAVLTKYTAILLVLAPALALFFRGLYLGVRERTKQVWLGVGTLVGVSLLFTAPHWLKNVIWYGDPIYPMLHNYLDVRPWAPEALSRLKILEATGRPGTLDAQGLRAAAEATLTFSFIPNNWEYFYGKWPVFGSLFTLSLPLAFFVRGGRRVLWLYGLGLSALFIWYLFSHYDRYLVAVVPWMAAATAATFVLVAREGFLPKIGVVLLCGAQAIWGGVTPFVRTHNMLGDSPVRHVAAFLATGFEKKKNRLDVYEPQSSIGRALPPDATLLAHDLITILGFDRNWVTDLHQLEFNYARLGSPAAIDDKLKSMGVTHLFWTPWSINRDSLAEDLAFFNYAYNYTEARQRIGQHWIAALPKARPNATNKEFIVANLSCGGPYRTGWYKLSQLTLPVWDPPRGPKPVKSLNTKEPDFTQADFVVVDRRCHPNANPNAGFTMAVTRANSHLYVRTPARPQG